MPFFISKSRSLFIGVTTPLALNKERVLMIGDSVGDVKAAHSAGVMIASVLWDSYAKDKVLTMNADYVFHTVDELRRFLDQD